VIWGSRLLMVLEGYCREALELAWVLRRAWAAAGAEGAVEEQITQLLAFNRCFLHLIPVLTRQEELDAAAEAVVAAVENQSR
jgi:hypothetical protein